MLRERGKEWAGGERCGQAHLLSAGESPLGQEGEAGAVVLGEMLNWGQV